MFEREKLREFSRSRFPDSLRATEVAMLFEECHSEPGLLRHSTFGWFLHSGDHPEKRRLPASIPAKNCPAVALADRECHTFEYSRSAKLNTGVRN
jgi:hypothetical protein